MQYRVPKRHLIAVALALLLLGAALSLAILTATSVGYAAVNTSVALLFLLLSAALIKRFVVFDCAYRLGEDYEDFGIYLYRIVRGESHLAGKVAFNGKEKLYLLDRKGRKAVKNMIKWGDMTSNLIPNKRYALVFELDGKENYLILELNQAFADAITRHAALAERCFTDRERKKGDSHD